MECTSASWELATTLLKRSLNFLNNLKLSSGCILQELVMMERIDICNIDQNLLWYLITQVSIRITKYRSSLWIERSWLSHCLNTHPSSIQLNWCFECWNRKFREISTHHSKISLILDILSMWHWNNCEILMISSFDLSLNSMFDNNWILHTLFQMLFLENSSEITKIISSMINSISPEKKLFQWWKK